MRALNRYITMLLGYSAAVFKFPVKQIIYSSSDTPASVKELPIDIFCQIYQQIESQN